MNRIIHEKTDNMDIIKSPHDSRAYRHIQLSNGMDVILITDPDVTYSAASLVVGVGTYHDPVDFQGIAHFLEHMLFMGTGKYPNENEYSQYIQDRKSVV